MKFLFLFLVLISNNILGQTDLFSGGWNTSNTGKLTAISYGTSITSKVYRIECTSLADADILQFNLIVDGQTVPASFFEGSFVIVEGKNIFIQQVGNGKFIKGSWKVLQQADIAPEKIIWDGYPSLNKEILIASFKTEKDFVLSINFNSTGCTNTSMTVYIDGNPVKDLSNNIINFIEGSSVYGKGKLVIIKVAGACNNMSTINGDLKIFKQ